MSDMGNKMIFSENLKYYLERTGKDRKRICEELGIKYSTFCEWLSAKKYPRIDKIELLANYFGILKSDLIEKRGSLSANKTKASDDALTVKYADMFSQLSDTGKAKVMDYMSMVLSSEQ